jgi:hypothetical protein
VNPLRGSRVGRSRSRRALDGHESTHPNVWSKQCSETGSRWPEVLPPNSRCSIRRRAHVRWPSTRRGRGACVLPRRPVTVVQRPVGQPGSSITSGSPAPAVGSFASASTPRSERGDGREARAAVPVAVRPGWTGAIKPQVVWQYGKAVSVPRGRVVAPDGRVAFGEVGEDFADRLGEDEIVAALERLGPAPSAKSHRRWAGPGPARRRPSLAARLPAWRTGRRRGSGRKSSPRPGQRTRRSRRSMTAWSGVSRRHRRVGVAESFGGLPESNVQERCCERYLPCTSGHLEQVKWNENSM